MCFCLCASLYAKETQKPEQHKTNDVNTEGKNNERMKEYKEMKKKGRKVNKETRKDNYS